MYWMLCVVSHSGIAAINLSSRSRIKNLGFDLASLVYQLRINSHCLIL
jgi:hypothetical protein